MMWKFLLSCSVFLLAASAGPALADSISLQYTNFGGNTPTTEGPLTPEMGTAVVSGNSAVLTTNNAEIGAVWMDTALNTNANLVTLNFYIKVLAQAASGYGQAFGGSETLGGVRIWQEADWAESFQLMPESATTGTFAFRNETNDGVLTIGSYNTNTLYHVQLTADYQNNVATASINGGTPVNYSLRSGNAPGGTTSEIFVYLNGATGDVHNSIYIGDTVPVPLPAAAWMGLALIGGVGMRSLRRRLGRNDA